MAGKGLPEQGARRAALVFGDSSSANSPGQSPGCQCCFFPLSSALVSHRNAGPAAADSAELPLFASPCTQTRAGHPPGVPGGLAGLGAPPAPRSGAPGLILEAFPAGGCGRVLPRKARAGALSPLQGGKAGPEATPRGCVTQGCPLGAATEGLAGF